jgi:hypothetical protein
MATAIRCTGTALTITFDVSEVETDVHVRCGERKIVIWAEDIRKERLQAGTDHIASPDLLTRYVMSLPELVERVVGYVDTWNSLRALGCTSLGLFQAVVRVRPIHIWSEELTIVLAKNHRWDVMAECCLYTTLTEDIVKSAEMAGTVSSWYVALECGRENYSYGELPREIVRTFILRKGFHRLCPASYATLIRRLCTSRDVEMLELMYQHGLFDGNTPLEAFTLTGHTYEGSRGVCMYSSI